MNTTVSVENNNQKKWEPNREGPRFKEFFEIKKKIVLVLMSNLYQIRLL